MSSNNAAGDLMKEERAMLEALLKDFRYADPKDKITDAVIAAMTEKYKTVWTDFRSLKPKEKRELMERVSLNIVLGGGGLKTKTALFDGLINAIEQCRSAMGADATREAERELVAALLRLVVEEEATRTVEQFKQISLDGFELIMRVAMGMRFFEFVTGYTRSKKVVRPTAALLNVFAGLPDFMKNSPAVRFAISAFHLKHAALGLFDAAECRELARNQAALIAPSLDIEVDLPTETAQPIIKAPFVMFGKFVDFFKENDEDREIGNMRLDDMKKKILTEFVLTLIPPKKRKVVAHDEDV